MGDAYCSERVHDDYGVGFHNCSRKGVVERNGKLYCRQHDPEAVRARMASRDDKWRREQDAMRQREAERKRLSALKDAALDAIRKIAAGHNDPRALASEVLNASYSG